MPKISTPTEALDRYRKEAEPWEKEHLTTFLTLDLEDRVELLFRMMMHTNIALGMIKELVINGVQLPDQTELN